MKCIVETKSVFTFLYVVEFYNDGEIVSFMHKIVQSCIGIWNFGIMLHCRKTCVGCLVVKFLYLHMEVWDLFSPAFGEILLKVNCRRLQLERVNCIIWQGEMDTRKNRKEVVWSFLFDYFYFFPNHVCRKVDFSELIICF